MASWRIDDTRPANSARAYDVDLSEWRRDIPARRAQLYRLFREVTGRKAANDKSEAGSRKTDPAK